MTNTSIHFFSSFSVCGIIKLNKLGRDKKKRNETEKKTSLTWISFILQCIKIEMELNRWKENKIHMTTFMSTPNFLKYLMKEAKKKRKDERKIFSNTNIGFDGAA